MKKILTNKWLLLFIAILVVGLGGYFIINGMLNEEPIVVESPTGTPTEEASNEAGKTQPTAGLEEGSKEEEPSPSLIPSEAASPIPSPTELPTPTVTPTPLPTSTPTPSPIPLPTQIPVEEMSFVYEIQRGDNVWYRFTEDTLYVTGTGKVDAWDKPGNRVTDTERNLTDNMYIITKIVIEEGVTHIGKYAFYGSSHCQEVVLPNSLVYVDEFAFTGCGGLLWPNGPLVVTNIDKERAEFHKYSFVDSGYDDAELMAPLPTPTPTPVPIPAPKEEEVDPNNPKMIARVQMGDNAYFEFYDNYEMHVVGSGRTWDMPMGFDWQDDWMRDKYPHIPVLSKEYADNLKLCYIGDDITSFGDYIFGGMHFERVSVPPNLEKGSGFWLDYEVREK